MTRQTWLLLIHMLMLAETSWCYQIPMKFSSIALSSLDSLHLAKRYSAKHTFEAWMNQKVKPFLRTKRRKRRKSPVYFSEILVLENQDQEVGIMLPENPSTPSPMFVFRPGQLLRKLRRCLANLCKRSVALLGAWLPLGRPTPHAAGGSGSDGDGIGPGAAAAAAPPHASVRAVPPHLVAELRRQVAGTPGLRAAAAQARMPLDDGELARWVASTGGRLDWQGRPLAELVAETAAWRRAARPHALTAARVGRGLAGSGLLQLHRPPAAAAAGGGGSPGGQVILFRPCRYVKKGAAAPGRLDELFVLTLEEALREMGPGAAGAAATFAFVCDFEGFKVQRHLPPMAELKQVGEALKHYPGRLTRIFVLHPSPGVKLGWKVMKGLFHQRVRDMICFVSTPRAWEEYHAHVAAMGGQGEGLLPPPTAMARREEEGEEDDEGGLLDDSSRRLEGYQPQQQGPFHFPNSPVSRKGAAQQQQQGKEGKKKKVKAAVAQ